MIATGNSMYSAKPTVNLERRKHNPARTAASGHVTASVWWSLNAALDDLVVWFFVGLFLADAGANPDALS